MGTTKVFLIKQEESKIHRIEQRHEGQMRASGAEFVDSLAEAEVLVGFPADLEKISLSAAPKLKWIHTFSAGVERVLTEELKASSVVVSNSAGAHAIPIAEHVLGFILLFAKKFPQSLRNQREKLWRQSEGMSEIRDAVLVVVGLGRIGTEIARVCSGAGMRVFAVDVATKEKPAFVHKLFATDELEEPLPQADYVVLALPHTPATHHLFDGGKFRIMKQSAIFINIGRGALVHEQELIEALGKGHIAGAALDVTEKEPLPAESPLWGMPNVVITPHHSSHTKKRMDRTIDLFCKHLRAWLREERLPNLVDKQKGY